jgi:ElaB/YqjD/DUF883 family membrane-anchored ribosome-binding protein
MLETPMAAGPKSDAPNPQTPGGRGKSRTAAQAEELSAQIETLRKDVAAISATLAELLRTGTEEGRERIEQEADHYLREGRRQADAALSEMRAMGEDLERQISRNPLTSVLVALGLGFLIGVVSRR